MCTGDVEHLLHLFFDCRFAEACWQKAGLSYDMWEVESAPVWLLHKLCTETSENLIKIATVLWGIWWARNKRVWENKEITPDVAIDWSSKQVLDWREMQKRRSQAHKQSLQPTVKPGTKWVPPPLDTYKINVDASVFEDQDYFSVGMVLRDHLGQFVRGRVLRFAGHVDVLEAELVGILEALHWSKSFAGRIGKIESDSQQGVRAINSKLHNHLEVGHVVDQCRLLVGTEIGVSVDFIKRQANKVAHVLARIPCTQNSFIDFMSPPLCVLETILSDVLI